MLSCSTSAAGSLIYRAERSRPGAPGSRQGENEALLCGKRKVPTIMELLYKGVVIGAFSVKNMSHIASLVGEGRGYGTVNLLELLVACQKHRMRILP